MESGDLAVLLASGLSNLLIFGMSLSLFLKPPKLSDTYGYRSKLAMQNEDNWSFAQKFCGKWLMLTMLLILIIRGVLLLTNYWTQLNEIYLNVLMGVVAVGVVVTTEIKLKKRMNTYQS